MKKSLLFLSIFISAFNTGFSQNFNWINPGQTYLKMNIISDGIYRIDKNDFINAGISTSGIDPRTVKVYYKGNQIPVFFYGEQDGIFNDSDYFDFYGKRNYGGLTHTYDVNGNIAYITDEYYNLYSDTSAYFVGWGGGNGIRYIDYNYQVSSPYPLNYFKAKIHIESDLVYWLGETLGGQDYRYFLNDKFQGEGWYWRIMANNNTQNNTISLPDCIPNSDLFEFKIFGYPYNYSSSVENEHRLSVRINNNLIDTIKRNDFNRFDTTYTFSGTFFVAGNNTVSLKFTPPSTYTGARMYLDMYEFTYPRRFKLDSNILNIYNLTGDTATKLFSVSGYNPANQINIYDYENGYRIINSYYVSDTLKFSGKANGKYEIINKQISKKPLRIKQKQVPNLVSNSTGADYLIVYNKLFEAQVEQLKQYRASHDGYRTFKAEIEDIYDILNYGMEDPVAVKRFIKNAYSTWQTPKIGYVTLFGRGSLDPKKILSSSVYFNNYVPVYGNPTAEGYFVNFNENTTTYYYQVTLGRIPAFTISEAQTFVNKIIQYESSQLDVWSKTAGMFTGGYNRTDQLSNLNQSEKFVNYYVSKNPLSLLSHKTYLNDTSGNITYNYYDSVINIINNGCLITNYIGHAGNGYWDFTFEDPLILNNQNKLPLVYSMTCFTGKNAEANIRGYGEKFIYNPNGGSIGFISTTGWSWSSSGNDFNEWAIKSISLDTIRKIGEIVKYASQKMSPDSSSFPVRNTINCNCLMGDPATKLLIPLFPEFSIKENDFSSDNNVPNLFDLMTVRFTLKNLGVFADSCKIRIQKRVNNNLNETKDTIIKNFGFLDTLYYRFRIDTIGQYKIKIILDMDNWYPMENKSNNQMEYTVSTKNYSFVPLKPLDNQIIHNDSVEIVGLNPFLGNSTNFKFITQIDSSMNFNSPLNSVYFSTSNQFPFTKFKVKIPILDSNILYFWRLGLILNNDTIGWSKIGKFISNYNKSISDTAAILKKLKLQNYNDDYNNNLFIGDDFIQIKKFEGDLIACSYGGNPWDNSYLKINDIYIYLTGDTNVSGFIMAKISKNEGKILERSHIYFSSSSSSDSAIAFLNTFDTTHILMAIKLMPIFATNEMTVSLKNKFKEFGSSKIDSFSIRGWTLWSFISYSKLPNVIKSEKYQVPWGPTISQLNPEFQSPDGYLQMVFGPADNWKNFSWQQVLYPKTNIMYDVVGINQNNQEITLFQNITNNNFFGIDTVNAKVYPYIKLIAKLSIDTSSSKDDPIPYGGIPSPLMKSMQISYCPPPEIAVDYKSVIRSDSIINEIDSIGLSYKYYNIGFKNCYGTIERIFIHRGYEKIILYQDTNFLTIKPDSSVFVKKTVKLNGYLPPYRKKDEMITLNIEVNPLWQNEIFFYNNIVSTDVVVRSSAGEGTLELFADGIKIIGGEYVKRYPELSIKYSGKDVLPVNLSDTSMLKVFVNNILYQFNTSGKQKVTEADLMNKNKEFRGEKNDAIRKQFVGNNSLIIYPELKEGENFIKILSRLSYDTGFDSIKYNVLVSNEFFVKDFYNYPNPMSSETVFMFTLAGNNVFECKLKIYTVAGKLIKIINSPVNIGFNQVRWDGRDEDGDAVSNGVYLYKLIVEGDGKKETPIQKLVVLK